MRRIFVFLFVCLATLGFAQTSTISGTLAMPRTSRLSQNTTLNFELRGCSGNQPIYLGNALIFPLTEKFAPSGVGVISGTIYRNDYLTCGAGTSSNYWRMYIVSNGVSGPPCDVRIVASTFDATSPNCINQSPTVASPTGDGTYARLDGTNTPFSGNITFSAALSAKSINNVRYASQFTGADAEAKIAAAVASLPPGGGTVYIDFVGAQTWGATLTATTGVNYIFQNCATYDATALTGSAFLSSASQGGGWNFIGAGAAKGGAAGNGCTVFKVANSSAQNINIVDQQQVVLSDFSVVKSAGSGGDVLDAAYAQNTTIRNVFAFPIVSGAKWVDGFRLNEDANGSSIYNTWYNFGVLPFSGAVGGITTNCLHITGGTGSKVANQNIMIGVLCGPHYAGVTGLLIDGGGTAANENRIQGDFSGNQTNFTIVASSARDLDMSQSTLESSLGAAYTIGTGNIFFRCDRCEVTGNNSQGTDNSAATSFWSGNVQNGAAQQIIAANPFGDILVNGLCFGAVTFNDTNCGTAVNSAGNLPFQVGGFTNFQITATGLSFLGSRPIFLATEGTAPSASANTDILYADSTSHSLKVSYNNGTFFRVPQLKASGATALGTGAIASTACPTTTTTATGASTSSVVHWSFASSPAAVTGYGGSATGSRLDVYAFPTANNVNFVQCNNTSGSITPSAISVNWDITE